MASALVLVGPAAPAHAATNKIVTENALAGAPASQWDIQGAGDTTLQGFTTQLSVAPGETVDFKIDDKSVTGTTNPAPYRIDIYRLGYYGGAGARLVGSIDPTGITQPVQPACTLTDPTGARLLDCGNWGVTASWHVPADAVSGIYIARPTRTADSTRASHIAFVVRDDAGRSDILVQTSDTTWQAYNPYGGYNAYYTANGVDGNAWKLSYNRPFTTRGGELENWLFNAEYPMLLWLERNGYDVSYTTHIDTGLHPERLLEHRTF
ncbi:MAG TPA: N,N-dimethylformamidase beta subunit family domain-containing protein, partial [Propionibacteriaceae bacterium]|nr:N,N-dimethylformamidase beta subunit family domain-containing protein [Propionibacteriaceae bacterium]